MYHFAFPPLLDESTCFPKALTTEYIVKLLHSAYLIGVKQYFSIILTYISLNMRKTENLFICLRAIYITFSHELSVYIFCQFFNWVVVIFLEFLPVPYISVILVLCMWYDTNISPSCNFLKFAYNFFCMQFRKII